MGGNDKSRVYGKNLSSYEVKLFEYSNFSLMEEVDIVFCKIKRQAFASATLDEDQIKGKILSLTEVLESQQPGETVLEVLQELYLLSMGEYSCLLSENIKEKRMLANQLLN